MAWTKQTARKTNTPGMATYQDTSPTLSSSEIEEVEEPQQQEGKACYNQPIFMGDKEPITQPPSNNR